MVSIFEALGVSVLVGKLELKVVVPVKFDVPDKVAVPVIFVAPDKVVVPENVLFPVMVCVPLKFTNAPPAELTAFWTKAVVATEVLFVFKFTDGIYYYEYCNEDLPVKIGGRCDRGRPEYKNYVYIDIKKLIKLFWF